jgi:threonine synthase
VAAGLAEGPPRLVAVQAERCAPLARAARALAGAEPGHEAAAGPGAPLLETAAEGIAIGEPPRLGQMLQVVADSGGTVITAREESIGPARVALAARGIDVEPTAAATYAAWLDWAEAPPASSVVLAMTGAGLKLPLTTGILAVL